MNENWAACFTQSLSEPVSDQHWQKASKFSQRHSRPSHLALSDLANELSLKWIRSSFLALLESSSNLVSSSSLALFRARWWNRTSCNCLAWLGCCYSSYFLDWESCQMSLWCRGRLCLFYLLGWHSLLCHQPSAMIDRMSWSLCFQRTGQHRPS